VVYKKRKRKSEAASGKQRPLVPPKLMIAKAGSLALVSDVDAIIEIARRTTSAVDCSVAEVVAQADKFPVFACVWPDPPSVRGYGMEIVKATGHPLVEGKGGVKASYRWEDVGAVLVRGRAFATEVARELTGVGQASGGRRSSDAPDGRTDHAI
jgi:hypothetical protein